MGLAGELADVLAVSLHGGEALLHELGEELFGLDEGHLNVAVRVAVHGELELDGGRELGVDARAGGGELAGDVGDLVFGFRDGVEFVRVRGEDVVKLADQDLHFRDELDESFRHEYDAEVLLVFRALRDDLREVVHDAGKRLLLRGDFLGDDRGVHVGLQRAFERDVGGGTAHELDEVPVFLRGVGVAGDVADELAVDLAGGVEAEGGLDELVLQVAVDGLRAADDLDRDVFRLVVLGEQAGVRVRVVAADDHEGGDAERLAVHRALVELFDLFELGAAGADHVESAGVAVGVHELVGDLDVVVVHEAARAALEAEHAGRLVQRLDAVVDARDHVVAAGGLAAGEDDRHVHGLAFARAARAELQVGHVAGGREEGGDLFGVGERGERGAFFDLHGRAVTKRGGQFRGVFAADLLKRGNHLGHGVNLLL